MRVLSLFDSMSCGQIALKQIGIIPDIYYASEIDKYAIKQTQLGEKHFRIRRLTPIECSRLQTIPSWYKWDCSDTQIYKILGNGWTIDVIVWILSFIIKNK